MAEYGINIGKTLAESAEGFQQFKEISAQPEILKQAYAGTTPEEVAKDPAKQQSIYAQAAAMAGQRGMNSLAYNFQKQANELSTAAQTKQLNDLKIKEQQATYANQLLSGAQTEQDLYDIVDKTVTDPAAIMQVKSILKRDDIPTERKKEILMGMTESAQNRIAAMNSLINAQYKQTAIENIKVDNERANKKDANAQTNREKQLEIQNKNLDLRTKMADFNMKIQSGRFGLAKTESQRKAALLDLKLADTALKSGASFDDLTPSQKKLLSALDADSAAAPTKAVTPPDWQGVRVSPDVQRSRDLEALPILEKELADAKAKKDKTSADAITRQINEIKKETQPKEANIDKIAKSRTISMNYNVKPDKRIEEKEVKTALEAVDSKYWDSSLKNPKTVTQVNGALGVSREAQKISDFIKTNKVNTGFFGDLARTIDKYDPRAPSSQLTKGFAENEAKLGKLVLDFANQYAKSVRGGVNPIATMTELKSALKTFGVSDMSATSAANSFKFIGDHYIEQKGKEMFNDEKAIKPNYYKENVNKAKGGTSAADEAKAAGF
jgi:hypothetical protein